LNVLLADRFTDLLTAWSTFGGALGSILAVAVAYLLLRKEIHTRNDEIRDAEAAQARMITTHVRAVSPATLGRQRRLHKVSCELTNHSPAPILEVELWAAQRDRADPDSTARMYTIVTPGETKSMTIDLTEPMPMPDELSREVLSDFTTAVTFTDSSGIRWSRVDTQRPQRVFPRPPTGLRRWWAMRRLKRLNPGVDPAKLGGWQ
jgi:hypothetical protein